MNLFYNFELYIFESCYYYYFLIDGSYFHVTLSWCDTLEISDRLVTVTKKCP